MTDAEQFGFDFAAAERERPLMEHWARLERIHREEWTEENLCIAWVTESDGRAWRDWWPMQPGYRRESMLNMYRAERAYADATGRTMRSHESLLPSKESMQQNEEIIETMVREIKEAAMARRPMPRRESEDMSPLERLSFRIRLEDAMNRAGVVIISATEEQA